MKHKLFFLVFALLFSFGMCAQQTEKIYFSAEWKVCEPSEATYYRVYKNFDARTALWEVKGYYKNGNIQWIGKIKNEDRNCPNCFLCHCHGVCTWYKENGEVSKIAEYDDGIKINNDSTDLGLDPYIGIVKGEQVVFRKLPSLNALTISELEDRTLLYVFSPKEINGYLKVIVIETSEIGYIQKEYVHLVERVGVENKESFKSTGYSSDFNSKILIENQTYLPLKIIIDKTTYQLNPNSKEEISIKPGAYNFIAIVPGMTPKTGKHLFEQNNAYEWGFYIVGAK